MRKNRVALILLIVLAGISAFLLIYKNRTNTLDKESSSFAVEDTSSITKVFLADKQNNTVTLTKNNPGNWTVNNEFKASKDIVNMLLKTIMSVEVREPVSKAGSPQVIKMLASTSVKVEIYQRVYRINLFDKIKLLPHEKKTKTYYVGGATQDNKGTYMLIDGSEEPYVTHIFGFNGFLTTRYSPLLKDWREHTIFNLKYNQIKSFSLQITDKPEGSFSATKKSPRDFDIIALKDKIPVQNYDTLKIMDLFSSFNDVRFEILLNDMDKLKKDSIANSLPYNIITLEDMEGKKYSITTFLRLAPPDQIDQEGKPVLYDRDRLYALINDKKDLVLIQFYVFNMIFKPLDYYLIQNAVKQ